MINAQPVYCDVSELLSNPVRTGIQRVAREVIRNWDGARDLRLCRFDGQRMALVTVPAGVDSYLLGTEGDSGSAPVSEIKDGIARLIADGSSEDVPLDATIIIPEVFFDETRCRHYLWRLEHDADKIHVLFFDFIPWLRPDIIGVERSNPLMWYCHLAQHVIKAAFISEATRQDWLGRIVRDDNRGGVVLPLGADGLPLARQHFSAKKRDFVALGSIDGRKNQLAIIQAFKKLWADGSKNSLTLVGSVFAAEQSIRAELEECRSLPNFRHIERATDDDVCEILSGARATIYASTSEGYGLPPVESLYAGIPCIVSKVVPSVQHLSRGVRLLDEPTPAQIAAQVLALSNDAKAEKAWSEVANLTLPTWKEFGAATAKWVEAS